MPVTISYPGVYIEELNGLSMSVSTSATAVPAFAVAADNEFFENTTRISSWMDYLNKKVIPPSTVPVPFDPGDILDVSMRTYYENGGGYCYLIPVESFVKEVPKLNDVTLLVAAGQDIESAISMLCVDGNCLFAIVDGPTNDLGLDDSNSPDSNSPPIEPPDQPGEPGELAQSTRSAKSTRATRATKSTRAFTPEGPLDNAYAGVYYPWLKANWADIPIPPSAAMAGVYAMVDLTRGVWKAPANVTLRGGVLPEYAVTDDLQGQHTGDAALNMIRIFGNGGPTVWGARTRLNNDAWRYISVRRLFNSAQRDIKAAMKAVMYEPNSQPTWEQARGAITNYLYKLWQQGGLVGASVQEAFFVQVGKDITMTQTDIDQGIMIVKVGMAAVRPAEFIILQFTQDMAH